jgi:hypothetical protein
MIKKIFVLFLFFQLGFGQKVIFDSIDDSYFEKYELPQLKKFNLKNLKTTKEDFYFRLSFHGTKIDFWKDSLNQNNGFVTKFVYQSKKEAVVDTIFRKYPLDKVQLQKLEDLIVFSEIDTIPDDSKIVKWRFGFDGITYRFENATKKTYNVKSYWSPKYQDTTLFEVKKINRFIDEFLKTTKIDSLSDDFQRKLPNGYTYSSNGSTAFYKLHNSSISLDYIGDYRLPFGFSSYYYVNKIAKKSFNLGASINYQVGFNGNSSVKTSVNKYNIFSDNKSYFDVIRFFYEKHDLDYIKSVGQFENYKINYAFSIDKYLNFGISYNQLVIYSRYNGLDLGISKDIESIELRPYYEISLYENQLTNYLIGVSKIIKFNIYEKPIRIYSNLYYEKLFDFRSLNFSLQIPLLNFGLN